MYFLCLLFIFYYIILGTYVCDAITDKQFSYMVYLYMILIVLWITAEEPQQGLRKRQIRVTERERHFFSLL